MGDVSGVLVKEKFVVKLRVSLEIFGFRRFRRCNDGRR